MRRTIVDSLVPKESRSGGRTKSGTFGPPAQGLGHPTSWLRWSTSVRRVDAASASVSTGRPTSIRGVRSARNHVGAGIPERRTKPESTPGSSPRWRVGRRAEAASAKPSLNRPTRKPSFAARRLPAANVKLACSEVGQRIGRRWRQRSDRSRPQAGQGRRSPRCGPGRRRNRFERRSAGHCRGGPFGARRR